jgi:hypothetical protein
LDRFRHCLEVGRFAIDGGELGDAWFEQTACFEDGGHFAFGKARMVVKQPARDELGHDGGAAPGTGPNLNYPFLGEDSKSLSHCGSADVELSRELALGWEPFARLEVANPDRLGDLRNCLVGGTAS